MSYISEHIREAACGPTPPAAYDGLLRAANWVGFDKQWKILEMVPPGQRFKMVNEDHQRMFLLLVAEALA